MTISSITTKRPPTPTVKKYDNEEHGQHKHSFQERLLNDKGGEGGKCFHHRPPKLDLHVGNLTYYLLPTILFLININVYYLNSL